jgi:hypothetical protein
VSNAGSSVAAQDRLVDQSNVRRAALGGLVGTALEQYDVVIHGTAMLVSPETRGPDLRLEDDAVPGRRAAAG